MDKLMNFNTYKNTITDNVVFANSADSDKEKQYCFKELSKILPFKDIK
jgi:hypothetical protein